MRPARDQDEYTGPNSHTGRVRHLGVGLVDMQRSTGRNRGRESLSPVIAAVAVAVRNHHPKHGPGGLVFSDYRPPKSCATTVEKGG
jgi:hypothetical protein